MKQHREKIPPPQRIDREMIEEILTKGDKEVIVKDILSLIAMRSEAVTIMQLFYLLPSFEEAKVPKYQGKDIDGPAIEFLNKHYIKWIEKDVLYQHLLRCYDGKLLKAILNQEKTRPSFILPQKELTNRELQECPDHEKMKRLAQVLSKRKSRMRS